jgi:DNA repair exonuclease SbcCD ATPase subunit
MRKNIFVLAVTFFVSIFFIIACSKGPAETAIKAAEEAVNAAKAEAAKVLPDEVKALEDSLASVKEKFVKKEYKAALDEATALSGKAKDVLAAAKAKKNEFTQKWNAMAQEIPQMLTDIQAKVDSLSKVKKLPAKMTKETLEEAKAGLASVKDEWTKAEESFKAGSLADAINAANAIKDKALKIMEMLGMSAPSPAPAPQAAPAPANLK